MKPLKVDLINDIAIQSFYPLAVSQSVGNLLLWAFEFRLVRIKNFELWTLSFHE